MKFISPLTWPGGKAKHFEKIKQFLPSEINTFIDLFCGGASVGLNVLKENLANKVIFNDLNTDLIRFWTTGIHQIELNYLNELTYPICSTIRELKNKINLEILNFGEKFLINNALTFNGMSWGTWTEKRLQQNFNFNKLKRVEAVRKLLVKPNKQVSFLNKDYKELINAYGSNEDIIWYLDPPYFFIKENLINIQSLTLKI